MLKPTAEAISEGISRYSQVHNTTKPIAFVKAGAYPKPGPKKAASGIMSGAHDWQLLVDLEKQLRFLKHIVSMTLMPDIPLVSEATKNIIIIELGAMGGPLGGGP